MSVALVLVGCAPEYDFVNKSNLTVLAKTEKSQFGPNAKYTISGKEESGFYSSLVIYMPNNFAQVGDVVTITNGIQAWPKK